MDFLEKWDKSFMDKNLVNNILKKNYILVFVELVTLFSFLVAYICNINFPIITIAVLMITGISLYIYFSYKENTLFSLVGIFTIVWYISISLSQFRLNINQIPFSCKTWVILYLTYSLFILGYFSNRKIKYNYQCIDFQINKHKILLVIIVLFVTIICFLGVELYVSKEFPLFSNDPAAYLNFSISGIHYFVVSCILIPPLIIIYLDKNSFASQKQKVILILMAIICFLIPILIVSRQLLLLGIILSSVTFIILNKKYEKKVVFSIMIIAILAFTLLSLGRNQNSEYLNYVFNSTNQYTNHYFDSSFELTVEELDIYNKLYSGFDSFERIELFELPMPIYQIYMYITFNFDNLNFLIASTKQFYFGINIFYPILALTGIRFMFPLIDSISFPRYLTTFNTFPICFVPYSDFGILGLIIYMFVIGMLSQKINNMKTSSVMNIIYYGLFVYSLLFSFFTSFFSNVTMVFYFAILFLSRQYIYNESSIIFKKLDDFLLKRVINYWNKL